MKIVELILDAQKMGTGIEAVSLVEDPAIESNFVALKKHEIQFATVNNEKRILMGPALIPNKPIYRHQELNGQNEEFYVYFSKQTIRDASQLYLKAGNQSKATLEHEMSINGLTLVESWIKEDMEQDKSAKYNMSDPVGTWYISMKVDNAEIWENYVKTGKVKGFSIEGYFADKSLPKIEQSAQQPEEEPKQQEETKERTFEEKLAEVRSILEEYQKSNSSK